MLNAPPTPARRGFLGLSAARGAAALVSMAWLIFAARELSLPVFGDLVLLLALGAMANTISDPGVQFFVERQAAVDREIDGRMIHGAIKHRLVVASGCVAATTVLYLFAARSDDLVVPLVFGISMLATPVYQVSLTAYRGLGRVSLDGINEVGSRLLVLVLGAALLSAGAGLRGAVAAYAIADVTSAACIYLVVRQRHSRAAAPDAVPAWRARVPIFAASIVVIVYYRVDTYLVGLLRDSAEAGLYGASYRFLEAILIPAGAVASIALAHTARHEPAYRAVRTRRLVSMAVLATVPLVVGGMVVAGPRLGTVFGPEFRSADLTLRVLLLSAPFAAGALAAMPVATLVDRSAVLRAAIGALALNTVGNLVLIPIAGGTGAAVATLASQAVFAVLLWRASRAHEHRS